MSDRKPQEQMMKRQSEATWVGESGWVYVRAEKASHKAAVIATITFFVGVILGFGLAVVV